MAVSASYIAYVKDVFAPFGEIHVRKMFGGAGVYCDGRFFAIIGDDDLWLKVDDLNRDAFRSAGARALTFEMKDGETAQMSYYSAPEEMFDDDDALREWVQLALDAADRQAAKKKPRKKGPSAKQPGPETASTKKTVSTKKQVRIKKKTVRRRD